MKRMMMTLFAAMTLSLAMAQSESSMQDIKKPEAHASTPEELTSRMVEHLGLNAKQAKKLGKLNNKYGKELTRGPQPPRNGGQHRPEVDGATSATKQGGDMKKQGGREAFRPAYEKELKTILTDRQFNQYRELLKARRGGKQGKNTAEPR